MSNNHTVLFKYLTILCQLYLSKNKKRKKEAGVNPVLQIEGGEKDSILMNVLSYMPTFQGSLSAIFMSINQYHINLRTEYPQLSQV